MALPVIEVRTLGAGGGSIARIDKGGMLSRGTGERGCPARPRLLRRRRRCRHRDRRQPGAGPAQPRFFPGRGTEVAPGARGGGDRPVGLRSLGLSREAAAQAIVDLADENMTNAIRLLTIERGIDPRDFALVAFGGAGPLHAAAIAAKLGIRRVVVPPHPGLCSAFGAALARLRVERVQTLGLRHCGGGRGGAGRVLSCHGGGRAARDRG